MPYPNSVRRRSPSSARRLNAALSLVGSGAERAVGIGEARAQARRPVGTPVVGARATRSALRTRPCVARASARASAAPHPTVSFPSSPPSSLPHSLPPDLCPSLPFSVTVAAAGRSMAGERERERTVAVGWSMAGSGSCQCMQMSSTSSQLQGNLAHKNTPTPIGPPYGPKHRATVKS